MKHLDPRIQRLLDGDLSPEEEARLEADLDADPAERRDLAAMEELLAMAQRPAPSLPQGFERRVMARIAVTAPPRLGFWARLRRAWTGPAWMPLGALAGAGAALVMVGVFAGYQAGVRAGAGSSGALAAASEPSPAYAARANETVLVRFALRAPDAKRVEVVGSFNGWGAKGVQLNRAADGAWVASLPLTKGRYEYTFVVDGERWVPDPSAGQLVDDGFGGQNAVLEL